MITGILHFYYKMQKTLDKIFGILYNEFERGCDYIIEK